MRIKPAKNLLSGEQKAHGNDWDRVHGVSDVDDQGKVTVRSDAGRTEYDAEEPIIIRSC